MKRRDFLKKSGVIASIGSSIGLIGYSTYQKNELDELKYIIEEQNKKISKLENEKQDFLTNQNFVTTSKTIFINQNKIKINAVSEDFLKFKKVVITDLNKKIIEEYNLDIINKEFSYNFSIQNGEKQNRNFCISRFGNDCKNISSYELEFNKKGCFLIHFKGINAFSFFISRNNIKKKDNTQIGLVYPNFTWQAYNEWGKNNFYAYLNKNRPVINLRRPLYFGRGFNFYHASPQQNNYFLKIINNNNLSHVPLTNEDIHDFNDWKKLNVLILSSHDEYWTTQMRVKLENWVRNGGKLLIFGGNTCWIRVEKNGDFIKREIPFFQTNLQEEKLTGLSFRFAGYPIHNIYNLKSAIQAGFNEIDFKNSGGMKVLDSSHPIFYKTDLKNNDMFGIESKVLDNEIDGIPIEPKTNKIVSEFKYMFPKDIKILASGWATRPKGKFNYFGSIVEFNLGKGKVMNFGSIGWANSIAKNDPIVKTIISNAIKYFQT